MTRTETWVCAICRFYDPPAKEAPPTTGSFFKADRKILPFPFLAYLRVIFFPKFV
jgi:hypothetical protein